VRGRAIERSPPAGEAVPALSGDRDEKDPHADGEERPDAPLREFSDDLGRRPEPAVREDARASAAGAPIGWVIGAREPQTPATEARILRRERLRQPRQTPAEPHPTLFNARKPAKVHR
jgi:hypothetical protein